MAKSWANFTQFQASSNRMLSSHVTILVSKNRSVGISEDLGFISSNEYLFPKVRVGSESKKKENTRDRTQGRNAEQEEQGLFEGQMRCTENSISAATIVFTWIRSIMIFITWIKVYNESTLPSPVGLGLKFCIYSSSRSHWLPGQQIVPLYGCLTSPLTFSILGESVLRRWGHLPIYFLEFNLLKLN